MTCLLRLLRKRPFLLLISHLRHCILQLLHSKCSLNSSTSIQEKPSTATWWGSLMMSWFSFAKRYFTVKGQNREDLCTLSGLTNLSIWYPRLPNDTKKIIVYRPPPSTSFVYILWLSPVVCYIRYKISSYTSFHWGEGCFMIKAPKCTHIFLDHYQFSKSQNHAHFFRLFC